ncbi:MAG: RNA polymerase sigma factor [Planctomycetota bacterium]
MEAAVLTQDSTSGLVDGELRTQGTELLVREEPALRRVIRRYVHDESTVDDLFQEISIKVLRRINTVRSSATIRGWLFQLARNACLDYLRAQDRRPSGSPAALGGQRAGGEMGRNPVESFLSDERLSAVHRALEQLPDSQRRVIALRIQDGLDHMEIAERLGISRQAVEVRLCRGRATLKQRLEDILKGDL